MTDKEIIQALEYYQSIDIIKSGLDLINRQQAEIERLTINMNAFGLGMKQEKERADTIKAEAIKEFWSRLQGIAYQSSDWSHGEHPMVVELDDAEEIYEEMVGEQECD